MCNAFLLITTSITVGPLAARSIHTTWLPVKATESASDKPEIRLNKKGALFVKKYIKNSKECLISIRKRSMVPFLIIDSVLKKYHLPLELKYLAVIESELKPSALSRVGARGPWQLMPGTAHDLGLKTSRQNDERVNYYKSTRAAALYLRDLYAQFGDWLLVLAAYNGGPKPVLTAIHKSGSRNFWALQNYLPAESREHVKKFIATHYYFEGRGSVTTLTRAENMANMKKGNALAKTGRPKRISVHKKSIAPFEKLISKTKDLAANSAKDQKNGPENTNKDNKPENDHRWVRQYESSDQKFRRLMKESAEALKRSNKLI